MSEDTRHHGARLGRFPAEPRTALELGFRTPPGSTEPLLLLAAEGRREAAPGVAPEDAPGVLDALVGFGARAAPEGRRPGRVVVDDPDLARALRPALDEAAVPLETASRLALLDAFAEELPELAASWRRAWEWLDGPGMSASQLRGFAEAADLFWRSEPWERLAPEDAVSIASDEGTLHVAVTGPDTGEPGLIVSSDDEELLHLVHGGSPSETRGTLWVLRFVERPAVLPPAGDPWRERGLPVPGGDRLPHVVCKGPGGSREEVPPVVLARLEGLLHVLAAAEDEQLDAGRFAIDVETAAGRFRAAVELPGVLELVNEEGAVDDEELAGDPSWDVRERAAHLTEQARLHAGRAGRRLAREAVALDPDAVEARLILAASAVSGERVHLYESAVEASGRRQAAGAAPDADHVRARHALAGALHAAGRHEEAFAHLKELLQLDPGDADGVRFSALELLLETGDDARAGALLELFPDEDAAAWALGRALLLYRASGDCEESRAARREAVQKNPFLADLLTMEPDTPDRAAAVARLARLHGASRGADESAIPIAGNLRVADVPPDMALPPAAIVALVAEAAEEVEHADPGWQRTPGARLWLLGRRTAGAAQD